MSAAPRVVVAGGGTGGHVFPAIALATALRARGAEVEMLGTAAGLEARAAPAAGLPLHVVPARALRGGGVVRAVTGAAAAVRGVGAALGLLGRLRPDVVVGVGGYASVAGVTAAWLRRIPTLLQEQNAMPGLANRVLGRIAARVCTGFEAAAAHFPRGRCVHTGNPIRAAVLRGGGPGGDLLVFGGSQGARRINRAMVGALDRLRPLLEGRCVLHQTGAAEVETVAAAYAAHGIASEVAPFIDDMGAAYSRAALVVARAGALSCAEITARGLPAVLVPYPHAADDHQRHNALALVAAGAAEMILDDALDGPTLAEALTRLFGDDARRARMAAAARAMGRPDAAERVADAVLALAARRSP